MKLTLPPTAPTGTWPAVWLLFILVALVSCTTPETKSAAKPPPPDELSARIPAVFEFAVAQYEWLLPQIQNDSRLPRSFENNRRRMVGPKDWTSGFFPGALWYLYEYTNDPKWKVAAHDYTTRLEPIKDFRDHHDVGFMLGCSYGNGYRLTGDPAYRAVLIQGARSLATRFKPEVGAIRSWDFGRWKYPVIVDNMMNLELLTWAARESGETQLHEIARQHADKTRQHHFRPDGSSYHLVDYDPATGTVLKKQTVQGFADNSAWARGQAWGLYGFTMMYRETRQPEYLAQAGSIARFILNHPRLPADKIPYWDFDAPNIPDAPRDTSAAAIMAAALLELEGFVSPAFGRQCRELARQQLLSLSAPPYLGTVGANGGFLLNHAVGHIPEKHEIDVPIIYADYYFLEALLRYRNKN